MTKEQRLENIMLAARAILERSEPRIDSEATERIVKTWVRIQSPSLGFKAPVELLDDEDGYAKVMDHLEDLYKRSVGDHIPVPWC